MNATQSVEPSSSKPRVWIDSFPPTRLSVLVCWKDVHVFLLAPLALDAHHQEFVLQRLIRTNPLAWVQLHATGKKVQCDPLVIVERALLLVSQGAPHDDLAQVETILADSRYASIKHAAMLLPGQAHPPVSKHVCNLDHGLDVVGRVEEGEPAGHDGEQDHTSGPDVELGGLLCAFEENLGGTEPTCAGAIGPARRAGVVLWVAMVRPTVGHDGLFQALPPDVRLFMAEAGFGVLALPLCEAKVHEDTALCGGVVEEVCGLDVAMYDTVLVNSCQRREERAEVDGHVGYGHVPEIVSEIMVAEVGEDGDDLICASKGSDQGADGGAVSQVVKQLELVEDPGGGGGHVDLLDGDKARPRTVLSGGAGGEL